MAHCRGAILPNPAGRSWLAIDIAVPVHAARPRRPIAARRRLTALALAALAVVGGASALDLAPTPAPLAMQVAREYGLNEFQTHALLCVRRVENGAAGIEYGVLHPQAIYTSERTQARWAAGTIKKRLPDASALGSFARRWAPIGAENDPLGLNRHWLPNMRACLAASGAVGRAQLTRGLGADGTTDANPVLREG